jgi:hypothetical protein
VVRTISFKLLYGLVILDHLRREDPGKRDHQSDRSMDRWSGH